MTYRHTISLAIATTVLLWACSFVAIRVALPALGPAGLTLGRLLLASTALAAAAPLLRVRRPARGDLPRILACGALGMAGYYLLLSLGERTVPAGTASLLVNTGPIFATLLAWVVLRQRPQRATWFGLALGFSGATTITLGLGQHLGGGVDALLVLAAAASQATFFVLQKPLLERYSGTEVTCYASWAATVLALPAATQLLPRLPDADPAALVSVAILGLGSSALAMATWAYVLARTEVAVATNFLYLVPGVAVAAGWLVLGERPTVTTVAGGLIVLAGAAVTRRYAGRGPAARRGPHPPRSRSSAPAGRTR